mmetsp:Transcript_7850/g.9085  ORF Transcript_7850/g.9085 Transcript_7850/m.9085 type:complete len:208 (+) Transcript_7850:63-686(+)
MSRRSRHSKRGLIRKGVIQTNSTPNERCSLESSFDLFCTQMRADIRTQLSENAKDDEVSRKILLLWRHLSPRDRKYWNKLADNKNQRYLEEHRIVSHCEIVGEDQSPPQMSKEPFDPDFGSGIEHRSLFCIEEDDESLSEDDDKLYGVSRFLDNSLETESIKSSSIPPDSPDRDHSLNLPDNQNEEDETNNSFIQLSLAGLSGSGSL